MKKITIALISGMLMGLTPAPVEAWFLAWIALTPLWILIRQSTIDKNQYKSPHPLLSPSPLFLGFSWGCGYHGLALFWITGIHPMTWMGVPWLASLLIALFCWIFITLWGAGLVVAWSVGMSFFEKSKLKEAFQIKSVQKSKLINILLRVLFAVALWCGLEFLWSKGSLWWTSLAYTQSPHNLAILQLSQISGPSTITAAIVAVNGLFAEALLIDKQKIKRKKQFLIVNCALIVILHLTGFWLYSRPLEQDSQAAIEVGIIQGNIPNEIKLYSSGWRQAIEGYTTGYKTLADRGVDIILTPETALPFFWDSLVNSGSSFYWAIIDKQVPVWVGAFGKQGDRYTNSLFTISGNGDILSRYNKVKLVPLGEYIPFESILGSFIDRLSPLEAHLAAGKSNQIFDTPVGRAIVGICYESAFSEHFRHQAAQGAEFILTASNNAHYSNTMPAQHHAQDVMRAIETDRWAARATNTGYSAIVDPRGRTLWISGINTYELHTDTIYRRQTRTLYVRWGDWLTVVLLALGLSSWSVLMQKEDVR